MKRAAILAGLILTGFASATHAAPGVYAGISAGVGGMYTKHYSDNNNPYSSVSIRNGAAYRAALGYLMGENEFNYGAELGYTGYPKNTYKEGGSISYSGHAIDLLGVGQYNFNSGFFLLGKAGAAVVTQRETVRYAGTTFYNQSTSKVKPELAVGAGYHVTKNISVDATFSHIFGGSANPNAESKSAATRISAVNTLMAGITYNFS